MKTRGLSWNPFLELLAIFSLIVIYIWQLRDGVSWIPILMLVIGSHFMREDTLRKVGFYPKDLKKCFHDFGGQVFIGAVGSLLYLGLLAVLVGGWTVRDMMPMRALWNLRDDIISGLAQQYLLNGYFLNRLVGFFGDEKHPLAPWLAAVFFSVAHFPNGFLMLVTFWGGYFASLIFLKSGENRNLYFLALAHGLIKFLLFLFVPDGVSLGFRVGPDTF